MTVTYAETAKASSGADEARVAELYEALIEGWNDRDATAFAAVFVEDGSVIGFDGSDIDGRTTIEREMGAIFADHTPARYVANVRSVTLLAPTVALLHAVVGMIPPGEADLEEKRHAHQTVVARKDGSDWRIALFQNTPARYDGRPELVEALTDELRGAVGR